MSTCAILFAKYPQPGKVKTRLHSYCTPEQAADLYQAFLLDSVELLGMCQAERKVVAYAPIYVGEAMLELVGDGFELMPQPQVDLGQRMDRLMRWSFDEGIGRTVILGSDSPSLPVAYIDDALERLVQRNVVLGPSTDGGYYLVGQNQPASAIFSGVDWSTGRVLEQTIAKLGKLSLGLLPPWYDVDTPEEAGFLKMHLEGLRRAGEMRSRSSLAVLEKLDLPLPS